MCLRDRPARFSKFMVELEYGGRPIYGAAISTNRGAAPMKSLLFAVFTAAAFAQVSADQRSPAEAQITYSQQLIAKNPGKVNLYNGLAAACVRRARETGKVEYYRRALEALDHVLGTAPSNFEALKIKVSVLLGEDRFEDALKLARTLNAQTPDDVMVYGYIADAEMALGNYKKAEESAQWMLNLRPNNVPGLLRGSRLRVLFGDRDGALAFWKLAFQQISNRDVDERAQILVEMSDLELEAGRNEPAGKLAERAQAADPEYPGAVTALARVRAAQRRYPEAEALLRKGLLLRPDAHTLFLLARVLQAQQNSVEPGPAYAEFEKAALSCSGSPQNDNLDLIFYYLDVAHRPKDGLRLATREFARRQDVLTRDAYAWALHANGNDAEARQQIEQALSVGFRDAGLFFRSGMIVATLNDNAAASQYMQESLEVNANSTYAASAREFLARAQSHGSN